jgi:SAM-dependent methyltransferase
MPHLVCPQSRKYLFPSEDGASLLGGSVSYPVREGVPDLLIGEGPRDVETDFVNPPWRDSLLEEIQTDEMFRRIRRWIEGEAKRLSRGLDFADIGCGKLLSERGRYFQILKDTSRSYVGVEPSWEMIRRVPKANLALLPDAWIVRSVGEDLPVAPASADVVISLSALDHCADVARVLALAREALRPGGILVVTLQNRASWYRRLAKALAPGYIRRRESCDHHHQFFTHRSVGEALADAGFSEVELVEQGFVNAPVLMGLVAGALGWVGKERGARLMRSLDARLSRLAPGRGAALLVTARR